MMRKIWKGEAMPDNWKEEGLDKLEALLTAGAEAKTWLESNKTNLDAELPNGRSKAEAVLSFISILDAQAGKLFSDLGFER